MRAAPRTALGRIALAAALAAALAGCALKSPPPVADLQKEAQKKNSRIDEAHAKQVGFHSTHLSQSLLQALLQHP